MLTLLDLTSISLIYLAIQSNRKLTGEKDYFIEDSKSVNNSVKSVIR